MAIVGGINVSQGKRVRPLISTPLRLDREAVLQTTEESHGDTPSTQLTMETLYRTKAGFGGEVIDVPACDPDWRRQGSWALRLTATAGRSVNLLGG